MAKNIPYFKFFVSEWNDGDITLESFKIQGVFISICSYYWSKECQLSIKKLQKRFKNCKKEIIFLQKENYFQIENEQIRIKFLDEQFQEKAIQSITNAKNGKLGGRPKKQKETEKKPNGLISQTENKPIEKREEKRRKENIKKETKKATPEPLDLNLEFGNEKLANKFLDWVQYRKEIKKTLKPSTAKSQIKFLKAKAPADAIAIIEQSILNGWTGLFEVKGINTPKNNFAPSKVDAMASIVKGADALIDEMFKNQK